MFRKVLIANRGEIALRVIRACKELGLSTVALYSEADRECLHVRFADDDVCIGRPPSRESYLNIPRIIAAAEITGADAIHPGYGFLAENAEFADIVGKTNITFVGPTPDQIRQMGDKAAARKLAQKLRVPTVPGSPGPVEDVAAALGLAAEIGFPVWARGLSPAGPFKHGPCRIGEPVAVGGVVVQPGDVIVADNDGVAVVPKSQASEIAVAAREVTEREAETRRTIRAGTAKPAVTPH